MAKLRFIKPWGPHKPGDIKENASGLTVHMLVDIYKLAVIEPDAPAKIETIPEPVRDLYKYVRKPQRDKMMKGPSVAKDIVLDVHSSHIDLNDLLGKVKINSEDKHGKISR